ncbi:uncharacterized protein [Macrobrachium rosenbergii]|uniref:uncharacterized protein n=1 Tax=Macrobrachium rosenbergii TaxID=79674 RepID=UPI0034D3F0E4
MFDLLSQSELGFSFSRSELLLQLVFSLSHFEVKEHCHHVNSLLCFALTDESQNYPSRFHTQSLASRGRRQREEAYEIRPHPHPPPHTLRQSRPYQPILPNHNLPEFSNLSFPHLEHQRRRGSILMRNQQGFPEGAFQDIEDLQFPRQKPRTWTARPRIDSELEGTTRDPAIPDNPEGLKNPSLLTGPWEEEPPVRITEAHFKGVNGSIVEAQAGTTANLPCVIIKRADHETRSESSQNENLQNYMVSHSMPNQKISLALRSPSKVYLKSSLKASKMPQH